MSKKILFFLIMILFISKTLQQNCRDEKNQDDKEKCISASSLDLYGDKCCYFTVISDISGKASNFCGKIPYSASIRLGENKTLEYDVIDGDLYKVDCGKNYYEDQSIGVLNRCGEDLKSFSLKKCKKYSSYVDSCCYYSGKKKDQKYNEPYPETQEGCYWLGAKYSGNINWAGLKLKCKGTFLQSEKILILLMMILMI